MGVVRRSPRRRGTGCRRLGAAPVAVILALATAGAGTARAEEPAQESAIHIGRLHYNGGGDWYSNPSSLPNWMRDFQQRTGTVTVTEEVELRPDDDAIYRYPLIYMNGHGVVKFTEEEAAALRTWMLAGGFLWADDNYGMDRSFRQEVRRIFPDRELEELPNDHPIYRCFYNLPGLPKIHEHDGKPAQSLVIRDQDRIVLLYTYESDIGDGIEDPEVHKDPPERREAAMRMATNVLVYVLTH